MPTKPGAKAKAKAKGAREYMGKACPVCLSHRRLVYRSECVVCLDLNEGKSRIQVGRQSSIYKADRAAYERDRYHHRKAMRTPLGTYMASFETVKDKRTMESNDTDITRANAQKAGRNTYNPDTPCQRCSTRLRYTRNGTCVECNKTYRDNHANTEKGRANNMERQARFRARRLAEKVAKEKALFDDI